MILETLEVSLGERSYPILIGRGLAEELSAEVEECHAAGRRVAVITDEQVEKRQADFIRGVFPEVPVLSVPAGESSKSFAEMERCCTFLAEAGLDRGGRVFAIGGGVVGDLVGYAAASLYRGIGFYQVPTTLLAMVDSSVGGKTGINLVCGKNLAGAFHQPMAVYGDLDTLSTLPDREFNAGMAEVIKHGMLADAELFKKLETGERLSAGSSSLAAVVARNCAIKAGVVSADEREQSVRGGRALLNLGHTFGHAIEAVAGYGTYLHGEAVAIGLVLATALSARLGNIDPAEGNRVRQLIGKYDLPVRLRESLPLDQLMAAMERDKKVRSGHLRYVVLEAIGRAVTWERAPDELVRELWREAGAVEG